VPLHAETTLDAFADAVRAEAAKTAASPTVVHGLRTQALFERLVASIGACKLLKQEDTGSIYHSPGARMLAPDYRIVLPDDRQLLVEVKNFHEKGKPHARHSLRATDIDALQRYADTVRCELLIATYWVGWHRWTLVAPDEFKPKRARRVIDFGSATVANRLSELGDVLIATRFPLRVRVVADPDKPSNVGDNGVAHFSVRSREFYCGDQRIEDGLEMRIALLLLAFGDWSRGPPDVECDGDRVIAIEFRSEPRQMNEEIGERGWDFIATLSSLVTGMHHAATEDEAGVMGVRAPFEPGRMGALIPPDYDGKALPLWRFQIEAGIEPSQVQTSDQSGKVPT
jgi:hypothetical protein